MHNQFKQAAIIHAEKLWADFYRNDRMSPIRSVKCKNDFNNNTTRFFRYPTISQGLAEVPNIFGLNGPVNYLIAPGSFGAEALSLAHCVYTQNNSTIIPKIYSIDNDPRVTAIAQANLFNSHILPAPNSQHGLKVRAVHGSHFYTLPKHLYDLVEFPDPIKIQDYTPPFDAQFAISCCLNLMCHLTPDMQLAVTEKLCTLTSHLLVIDFKKFRETPDAHDTCQTYLKKNGFTPITYADLQPPLENPDTIARHVHKRLIRVETPNAITIFVHENFKYQPAQLGSLQDVLTSKQTLRAAL